MKRVITSKCGNLKMEIDRSRGAITSQRLIDALLTAKRENQEITASELDYVAFGFASSRQ